MATRLKNPRTNIVVTVGDEQAKVLKGSGYVDPDSETETVPADEDPAKAEAEKAEAEKAAAEKAAAEKAEAEKAEADKKTTARGRKAN